MDYQQDISFMTIPGSLTDAGVASTFVDFTSKIKESAIPALPFHKIALFRKGSIDPTNGMEGQDGWNVVVTADEATELPPIVALPEELANLTVEEGESLEDRVVDEHKGHKDVFNSNKQSSSASCKVTEVFRDVSRAEVLEKIGEQQFEEVLFKPKPRKKRKRKNMKIKRLISGTESGSDTLSVTSARSNLSDSEDPWSSERLDVSSDWSGMSTRASSSANTDTVALTTQARRSSSEETLVRLGDSIISDLGSGDVCLPPCFQPDLRSPASLERAVADKERLLAEVLNLDTLCADAAAPDSSASAIPSNGDVSVVSAQSCTLSPVLAASLPDLCSRPASISSKPSEDTADEKLSSALSLLSYGPPSGSSAPPSNHASLELPQPCDVDTVLVDPQATERADSWVQYRTPDGIVSLAVSNHYICCTDSSSRVHYSSVSGLSLKWQKADDCAEQVALSLDAKLVWKLHKGTAYALVEPSQKGPFGEQWVVAAKDVQCVAVDGSAAWYVSLDSRLYVQHRLTAQCPTGKPVPVCCVLPAARVSCCQGRVWMLTSTDKVLYRAGVCPELPEGSEWREVAAPFPVKDMVLGSHSIGWAVDDKNVVYFTRDYSDRAPQWWQILISDYIFQPTTPLQHFCTKLTDNYLKNLRQSSTVILAAGENAMWISEKMADKVHMNKTEFTGHQWNRVVLKNLSPSLRVHKITARGICGDQGHLWMVSETGDFFCYYPTTGNFHSLPAPDTSSVACLSATPHAVWLLSSDGHIFVRELYGPFASDSVWRKINLSHIGNVRFIHISCGRDTVWACSDQGDIYMTIGSPRSMASATFAPAWIQVDEKPEASKYTFTKVYVGPQSFMVWAVDKRRNIYVRQQIVPKCPLGDGWSLVSGIEAVELSISESAVWALSAGGSVYRRYGITQKNCIGDYWKKIPGSIDALTATVTDGLWALDRKGSLLQHSQLIVTLCSEDPVAQPSDRCPSIEGDWEHIGMSTV